jgi:glyoxylase-like metal-dependent hydrolase (beta-lactamase superfamily II)
MIDHYPDYCPFCGAPKSRFLSMEKIMEEYHVKEVKITKRVTQLRSTPPLGYEHAAYRLLTDDKELWIDCPSAFDPKVKPPDTISFTHHHFLGASNLFREIGGAEIRIHEKDSHHSIIKRYIFDSTFAGNFNSHGIEAFHINGHTPGFTFYIFDNILFICDYVFSSKNVLKYNPFGNADLTRKGGIKIFNTIEERDIKIVCAYNYSMPFVSWIPQFQELITKSNSNK